MGDAAGQGPDRLHLLGLSQLFLEELVLGDVLYEAGRAVDAPGLVPDRREGDQEVAHPLVRVVVRVFVDYLPSGQADLELRPDPLEGGAADHLGERSPDDLGENAAARLQVGPVGHQVAIVAVEDVDHVAGALDRLSVLDEAVLRPIELLDL